MSVTENLSKKSVEEIQEILLREEKLLENKKLISTLKDKGAKIKESIRKLKDELEHRRSVDEVTLALSKLSSNDQGADLDSDDDNDDSPVQMSKEQIADKENDEEPSLNLLQDAFCKQRSDKLQDGTAVTLNPFRLNMTKKGRPVAKRSGWTKPPSDLDPDLSALSPVFSETPAQLLSLSESMSIQKVQDKMLKDAENKRRVERIYERFGTAVTDCAPEDVENMLYTKNKEDSEEESELSDIDSDDDNESDTEVLVQNIENLINDVL